MSTPRPDQAAPKEKSYFDLHTTGIGYLNRIRDVKPRGATPSLNCSIAALNGAADEPSYTWLDARVSGREAGHLVRRCKDAVDAGRKVLIAFRVGDLRGEVFIRQKAPRIGEPDVSLKVRLLYIGMIKIDGKLVYKAERKPGEADDHDAPSPGRPAAAEPQPAPTREASLPAVKTGEDAHGDVPEEEGVSF